MNVLFGIITQIDRAINFSISPRTKLATVVELNGLGG